MEVKDVMNRKVIALEHWNTAQEAAKLMKKHRIGSVIIKKGNRAVGIVTERDLIEKVVASARDPSKVKLDSIMSYPLITVSPYLNIREASKKMKEHKIKRLPVVESGRLVGILTTFDILKTIPQLYSEVVKVWVEPVS